jgi:hypothetical protein
MTPTEFNNENLLNRDVFYRTSYKVYALDKTIYITTKCKIVKVNKLTLTLKKYNADTDLTNYEDTTPKDKKYIILNWKDTINNYEPIFYINKYNISFLLRNKLLSFLVDENYCNSSKYIEPQ